MKPIIGTLVVMVVVLAASVVYLNSEMESLERSLQEQIVLAQGEAERNTQEQVGLLHNRLSMQELIDMFENGNP